MTKFSKTSISRLVQKTFNSISRSANDWFTSDIKTSIYQYWTARNFLNSDINL